MFSDISVRGKYCPVCGCGYQEKVETEDSYGDPYTRYRHGDDDWCYSLPENP